MSLRVKGINGSDEEFEILSWSSREGTLQGSESESMKSNSDEWSISTIKPCRSTPDYERQSERAIEPLNAVILTTVKQLQLKGPIFHTKFDSENTLYSTWLDSFPVDSRQIMKCAACQQFLKQFGDLCVVADDGALQPLLWPEEVTDVPSFYRSAVSNIRRLFHRQSVGDEFVIKGEKDRHLGKPIAGGWSHLSTCLTEVQPTRIVNSTDAQDTMTSYEMLDRVLTDYNSDIINRAYHILHDHQLPYSQSHKAPIAFLRDTDRALAIQGLKSPVRRKNLVTHYARKAFPGCLSSLRGGILGCLLQSVKDGNEFDVLRGKWIAMANPHSYMRPISIPSTGNVMAAEKMFQQLNYTRDDLARVYATTEQIAETARLWSSKEERTKIIANSMKMPLFDHLLKKANPLNNTKDDIPVTNLTFRNFCLRILPKAASIEVHLNKEILACFFTIGRAGSKPLMSFSSETNTASWYYWSSAARLPVAGLHSGWIKVLSIVTFPHMWEYITPLDALDHEKAEKFRHIRHDIRYLFCLKDIREDRGHAMGLSLFPTLMRGEFHPFRKTIEAFSKDGVIDQIPEGIQQVGGLAISRSDMLGNHNSVVVRVRTHEGQVSKYNICLFE